MRATANAWGIGVDDDADKADHETRITDFLAFFAFAFATFNVPVVNVPMAELAGLGIGTLALFRKAPRDAMVPSWLVAGLVAVPVWLTVSGVLNGNPDPRRLAHMASFALLGTALASGRISMPSARRGLVVGLPISAVTSLFSLGTEGGYTERLSGWIGDPNAAACYLSVLGLLCMAGMPTALTRYAFGLLIGGFVVLTYSRTGLLVLGSTVLWLVAGRRLKVWAGALVVVAAARLLQTIPEELRLWGPFAERGGSDALRDAIIAAEEVKLADAPFWGHGPGTSTVEVRGQEFFFHSSYYSVLNEGGWLLIALIAALLLATFLALGDNVDPRDPIATALFQMSLIAALLMSFTLGEVLLDLPMAIAIGMSARAAFRVRPEQETDPGASPDEVVDASPGRPGPGRR